MKRLLLTIFLGLNILMATDHTLIIGIGKYQSRNIGKLDHIETDISTYKKMLQTWGVVPNNIHILKNSQATQNNIKNNLSDISNKVKQGDRFFMFFSGHGTSLYDESYTESLQKAGLENLMTNSGAILPYDFNKNNISKTLIIGKRDIKPYLKIIDDIGCKSLIVFDACFAENSIRNKRGQQHINRTPHILTESKDYPYINIVYIASSILQSQSGKFSPILESCLINPFMLNKIKACINNKIGDSMQIPAIFGGR